MPKGIILSSISIVVVYAIGILLAGIFINWKADLSKGNISLANVTFIAMQDLGLKLGIVIGLGHNSAVALGALFARLVGLSMFLVFLGAFMVESYAPLKQLIEGTPKKLWPGNLGKVENGVPKNALWWQFIISALFIASVGFGGKTIVQFFNLLVLMTNIATVIPYMMIAFAYMRFKKNKDILKPLEIFKTPNSILISTVLVILSVSLATVFTVIQPAITGDYSTAIWQVVGPIIFTIISLLLYIKWERSKKDKMVNK